MFLLRKCEEPPRREPQSMVFYRSVEGVIYETSGFAITLAGPGNALNVLTTAESTPAEWETLKAFGFNGKDIDIGDERGSSD